MRLLLCAQPFAILGSFILHFDSQTVLTLLQGQIYAWPRFFDFAHPLSLGSTSTGHNVYHFTDAQTGVEAGLAPKDAQDCLCCLLNVRRVSRSWGNVTCMDMLEIQGETTFNR